MLWLRAQTISRSWLVSLAEPVNKHGALALMTGSAVAFPQRNYIQHDEQVKDIVGLCRRRIGKHKPRAALEQTVPLTT